MLSNFSVKKPLTIFVSVLLVIILGGISFTSMIPDLLPNINLPYAIVITTYPGATPEEVETVVSRPLEQSMASLENINSISSTSSDSSSMIMLEFTDTANMDVVVTDIREAINAVSGYWPDTVMNPFILKLNPNLLPVTVTSINYDGMDNIDLTNFLQEELLTQLEGIDGVASVDIEGQVEEQVNVVLSPEKIAELNEKIKLSLDKEFADAEEELNEGETEILDGLAEIDDGEAELDSAKDALEVGQQELIDGTAEAQSELLTQRFALDEAKAQLETQLAQAEDALAQLNELYPFLVQTNDSYNQLLADREKAENDLAELNQIKIDYPLKQAEITAKQAEIDALNLLVEGGTELTEEQQALLNQHNADMVVLTTDLSVMDAKLSALGTTFADIDTKIAEIETSNTNTDTAIQQLDNALALVGYSLADLNPTVTEMAGQIAMAEAGIAQLETALTELDAGKITIDDALEELNKAQLEGSLGISAGYTEITVGQSSLAAARTQLESAQDQIETAKEDMDEQKEMAYDSATVEITMEMVSQLLTAQNFSMPIGYVTEDDVDYLVRVGDEINGIEEMQALPLLYMDIDGVGVVTLSDVADVFITDNSVFIYSKVNGENSLTLSFNKQSTYATATVSDNLNAEFAELEEKYDGLNFSNLNDQGIYIDIVINSVLQNLVLGAILSVIILIAFLKDIRPTVVIAVSIPISLLFAIVLMYFSGVTLNVISLSGLAIGVGMLVDNSVVVIENIYRMRSEGVSAYKAAAKGANQVAGAIVASTLTTVCVFLPIVFIDGMTRDLFTDLALTVAYSLLASLIVALTLVPAIASTVLKKDTGKEDKLFNVLINAYGKVASASLRHKWIVLILSVALLIGSTALSLSQGFIFMPAMSSTELSGSIVPVEGATFDDNVKLADDVYERIYSIDGLETVAIIVPSENATSTGMMSMMMGGGGSNLTIYALIDEDSGRKDTEISAEILEKTSDLGVEISISGASSSMTTLGASGITLKIFGDNLDNLIAEAKNLAVELENIEGLTEISTGVEDNNPEIRIVVDKEKAIEQGLTVAQVFQYVASEIESETSSGSVYVDNKDTDIIIYDESKENFSVNDVKNIVLNYTDMQGEEKEVMLTSVADIIETESLNAISREDQKRTLTVSASVLDGYNVTLLTNQVQNLVDSYQTLEGNDIIVGGENETIMESMEQLALMAVLAVVIIYFIMVAQFQSFKLPFIVMFTIPLAFTGGFLALLLTGNEVSVVAMVGFVMLSGIIVNNGIVLIDYINILRVEGMEKRAAIVLAGKTRMRPILMTALTTVLGLVFMAVGTGVGTEMMQPIAIVCIGGLLYGTLMTLFVVPAMYDLLSRKEMKIIDIEN